MSLEEEKFSSAVSETSSVGKKSNCSSSHKGKKNKRGTYRAKIQGEGALVNSESDVLMKDEDGNNYNQSFKKVVHFNDQNVGHIELRDLKEKDFLDLIDSKNQDKRFYGWLHFGPIFEDEDEERHYNVNP